MIIREILHAHIPYLKIDSTLQDAIDKMDIYQFPALVFVDDNAKPIGIITEGDICREVQKNGSIIDFYMEPAFNFATKNPVMASPELDIQAGLELMLENKITLLPIVENDRIFGIVLRIDLLQATLIHHLSQIHP